MLLSFSATLLFLVSFGKPSASGNITNPPPERNIPSAGTEANGVLCDSLEIELEDILLTCETSFPFTLEAVIFNGGSFLEYVWLFNGDTISITPEVVIEMPGEYIFIATNTALGCSVSDTLNFILDDDPPIADAGPDGVLTCIGASVLLDGPASSTGPEFAYAWLDVTGTPISDEITATVSEPGVYFLIVTNLTNGCTASDVVVVVDDILLFHVIVLTTPDSCGLSAGSATAVAAPTSLPYLYFWSTGDTTASISGLATGDYSVTVTTLDGCENFRDFSIDSIACTPVTERLPGLPEVKISPNPNGGQFTVALSLDEKMTLEFSVVDVLGREVKLLAPSENFSTGQHSLRFEVSELAGGSYFLKIKSSSGQGLWKFVKVK